MFLTFTDYQNVKQIIESKSSLNEGILNKDYDRALTLISSYLSRKLDTKVPYSKTTQTVENKNGNLITCLLAVGDNGELIRLEWNKNSSSSELYSFSYFNGTQKIPIRTIIVQNNSLALILPAIIEIINKPSISINNLNLIKAEDGNAIPLEESLLKEAIIQKLSKEDNTKWEKLLTTGKTRRSQEEEAEYIRLSAIKFGDNFTKEMSPGYQNFKNSTKEFIAKFQNGQISSKEELIQTIQVYEAEQMLSKSIEKKGQIFDLINPDEEIQKPENVKLTRTECFEQIDLFTEIVGNGQRNAFLLTGMGGLGKTYNVEKTLKTMGLVQKRDWFKIKGAAGTPNVYKALFNNNGKLTVFDDCDSVLRDEDCVNLFKAALDTGTEREISYNKQGYFDPARYDYDTTDEGYVNQIMDGKFPSSFIFTGQIIFISNWNYNKIPQPMQTRCLKLDLQLTSAEVKEHIKELLPYIAAEDNFDMEIKEYMLECLTELMDSGYIKYMTIRDFVVGLAAVKLWLEKGIAKNRIKVLILNTVIGN